MYTLAIALGGARAVAMATVTRWKSRRTWRRRMRGGVTAVEKVAPFPDSTSRMFGRWSLGTRLVYSDDVIAHHQRMA